MSGMIAYLAMDGASGVKTYTCDIDENRNRILVRIPTKPNLEPNKADNYYTITIRLLTQEMEGGDSNVLVQIATERARVEVVSSPIETRHLPFDGDDPF